MKLTITKESILYDIENLAYVISDNGVTGHLPHRVADICQPGNIDRVARIAGLAFARCCDILSPVLVMHRHRRDRDYTVIPRNYILYIKEKMLNPAEIFRLKETVREFIVCMVLADWLGITLPPEAEIWRKRADSCAEALAELAGEAYSGTILSRNIPPL